MSLFLEEVLQQSEALKTVLNRYITGEADSLSLAKKTINKRGANIIFTGMGSSYFASHVAVNFLNDHGVSSFACEAGELFYYNLRGLRVNDILVLVSQSGKTIEVVKIVQEVKGKIPLIGITNDADSFLAKNCDVLLPMFAGKEEMSTSKTYINSIAVLLLLAFTLTDSLTQEIKEILWKIPDYMEELLKRREVIMTPVREFFNKIIFLNLVARGPSLATALQASVILKEGAHVCAEGISGASFRHGPIEVLSNDFHVIIFAPQGNTLNISRKVASDVLRLGCKVLFITDTEVEEKHENLYSLKLPAVGEYFAPFLNIIPIDHLIVKIAEQKRLKPGAITVGNKVTVCE